MTDKTNDKDLHPQILRMKKIAEDNGGTLLDTEWKGINKAYQFVKNNEVLLRTARGIFLMGLKNTTASKKLITLRKSPQQKLNEMKEIALKNNATLLSKKWISTTERNEFLTNGIKILISYKYLINKGWPKDINKYINNSRQNKDSKSVYKKETLEEIKLLGNQYNFELLDKEYTRKKTPLKFLDKNIDEIFYISHKAILEGKFENQYYGKTGLIAEPICKQALEHLFGYKFEKRKDILTKDLTKRNSYLELDGYCEELKLAFEYQGHPSHWNSQHENYEKVSKKDEEKKRFCKQLGITLLQIPNLKRNRDIAPQDVINLILNVIKKICEDYAIPMPPLNMKEFNIDYDKISYSKAMLEKLNTLAKENNAILLSKKWTGQESYYKFEKDGKKFAINYRKIQELGWPKNLKNFLAWSDGHKKTEEDLLKELKEYAKSKNAKLIDEKWINYDHKYTFQSLDDETKMFQVSKESINLYNKRKEESLSKPSYHDGRKIQALEKLKKLAEDNNCQLLSKEWIDTQHMYEFSNGTQTFKIRYEYLSKKGWPQNIGEYIKYSNASKVGYQNRE